MDIFIFDTSFNIVKILDSYKSLIWTERYNAYGDFEMCTVVSPDIMQYIKQDYYLELKDSSSTMIIEKIRIDTDVEAGNTVTITGRSLESILLRRIVWGQRTIKGNLQNGIKQLINENIISPTNNNRKISNFIFEDSDDPSVTSLEMDVQYTGDVLYDVISSVCAERGIGFKIIRNENNQFVFSLYSGSDRSYDQTSNPYVIFSPSFENMINSNYMESKTTLKNVTLIGGEGEGASRVYASVGDVSGLNRREIFTDARDITSDADIDTTDLFNFQSFNHPNQVYRIEDNTIYANEYFNSTFFYIEPYVGQTLRMTIPKYTYPDGGISHYATVYVDVYDGQTVYNSSAPIQIWEKNGETPNQGSLGTYEFVVPSWAKWIYASMFSQKAIDDGVYYGELTDFSCKVIRVSPSEYESMLCQRGRETLSENIDIVSFEGEVEPTNMFVYGKDFFMGDIVQISNEYGHEATVRILELVISDDETGISVYPTFSTITTEEGEDNQQ